MLISLSEYMSPFIRYSLQNPNKVLYISWQPNVVAPGIDNQDDLGQDGLNNMGIIVNSIPNNILLPSIFTTFKATKDLTKIYQSNYWKNSNPYFTLINLSAPIGWSPQRRFKGITIYRFGICPYIDKIAKDFVWKKIVPSSNEFGFVFGKELLNN